ncbi:MAG: tripartite tricarboxylate transporter substrate binding protein [Comamonas sp.]|jgi:tripartite-type tricarboxylate transporter receptor subunit TctC|uniref:Bug family tripartite tricarboxylate transporter substrate binding protein n=1 Tax=Comamonas sp. TaxID=34028 RepID=UPI002818D5D3|nr:tripartite tricarboxylate transporter substrate binding protein [Comamonas sp.]MDR0216219.1 tripartite tricarboxylate transporter substrate binding protein [Comamonas sp.]
MNSINRTTRRYTGLLLALLGGFAPVWTHAQGSDTPTRLVVAFAAGGPNDIMARALAEKMRVSLNEPVVVENRTGAGGIVATDSVKRAPKDGKTILISSAPPFVLYPWTYKQLPYNPEADFAAVAHLAEVPLAAFARADSPYQNFSQYLSWAKDNPASQGIGVVALGGMMHFGVTSMAQTLGQKYFPVPYRGGAAILTDLVGGNVPLAMDAAATAFEMTKSGKTRFLGVTGTKRSPLLPDVPTFKEQGIGNFDNASAWYIAFVPSGTPPARVARLESALIAAAKDVEVQKRMGNLGMVMTGLPGKEASQLVSTQSTYWKPIIAQTGFKADQ